jgi:hypothetical protein
MNRTAVADVALGLLPLLLLLVFSYAAARQLRRPSRWAGRRWMARFFDDGNRTMLDAAVEAMDARAGERIVDVGFGGGNAPSRPIPRRSMNPCT